MARRKSQPTLKEVAEVAGTSTAVVSYVVNSGPRPVAAATRQRVLDAIAELGYRPNRAAQMLASKRSKALGVVVPDMSNAFFTDLVRAIEQHARSRGFITFIGNTDYDGDHEQDYVEAFGDFGAEGIIVVSGDMVGPWKAAASAPLVFVHRRPVGAEGPVVRTDDRLGGKLATEHLLALGRGGVHCVAGPEDAGPVAERVDAWREAHRTRVDPCAPGDLVRVPYPRASAAAALEPWLRTLELPAAVFVTVDEQALGLLSAASAAGIRVPEDLAVVGYDNTSASAHSVPALTTVAMPYQEMATWAVDLIVNNEDALDTVINGVGLVVRRSCGRSTCTDESDSRIDP